LPPGYLPLGKNIPMVSILRVLKRSFRDPVRPPGQCARRRQGLFLGLSDCPQPMPGSLPNPEEIVDSFHGDRIAVNALKDEAEADKILQWLQQEINQAWGKREKIKPRYESLSKPLILEVLKLLPRTNCRQCGQPTCMVFAILAANTTKGPEDCLIIQDSQRTSLGKYLARFRLEL